MELIQQPIQQPQTRFSGYRENFPENSGNFRNVPLNVGISFASVASFSEILGQSILIPKAEEQFERAGGHVAQRKELLSHVRGGAGSNSARESRRAHTNLHARFTYKKEENQARSLKKAPVSRTGISHGFSSGSCDHEPHTLNAIIEGEVFKPFAFDCKFKKRQHQND